jgi:YbbR domain-containing protein
VRALIRNLRWKLLAIVSAIVLWNLFVGQAEVATSIPVVVQYRNIPADLEITADPPERLLLKLRGPASRLDSSSLNNTILLVDLKNVSSPGEQTITITENELGLPSGVELIRVVPSQVRVTLDRRSEKTVPVEVRYTGPPARGYRIVSQRVNPPTLKVIGPEAFLARLESVPTDPVNVSTTVGVAEFRVPVYATDPHLRFETKTPVVTVRVTLEKIPQS